MANKHEDGGHIIFIWLQRKGGRGEEGGGERNMTGFGICFMLRILA